jgi:hypothetical protein
MEQMARNAIDETSGQIAPTSVRAARSGHEIVCLVPSHADDWEREVPCATAAQPESERIRRTLGAERNHQGKGNVLLLPSKDTLQAAPGSKFDAGNDFGGLLNYYCRAA